MLCLKVSTFGEATQGDFNDDTEHLIRVDTGKQSRCVCYFIIFIVFIFN